MSGSVDRSAERQVKRGGITILGKQMTSDQAQRLFGRWNEKRLLKRLTKLRAGLVHRRVKYVDGAARGKIDPRERAKRNLAILQQSHLHRVERQVTSSATLLLESNVYGVALGARAIVESAGVIGFFCAKLEALGKAR